MQTSGLRIGKIVLALILGWSGLWAQGTAQINGIVRDESGAAVPGAEIRAMQTATNATRTTTSGADGTYVLSDLPIGPYTLGVNKDGFSKYLQSGIVLQVSSNPTIDVALKVGNVSEQISVEANGAQVETQETGIGQIIDNQRVLELPLTARDSQQLVILAGGAVSGGGQAANRSYPVKLISVAGAQTDAVTYVLDGATHNEPYINSAMPLPFPDALQEFRVETSAAPAQYGGHAGGVVEMVTKSGTNQFHGAAFEFLRNGALNARNTFAASADQLKRNQFGGVIGGPIKKDKLFFFFGDQYTKTISAPGTTLANVLTAQALAGDWSGLASLECNGGRQITLKAPFVNNQINPALFSAPAVALTRQKNWVIPTNKCGIDTYTQRANSDEQMIVGKVDYQMSAKNSLFVRTMAAILHQPTDFNGTDALSLSQPNYTRHAHSLVLGDTYLINPTTVASFRATALRTLNEKTSPDTFSLTDLGVANIYAPPTWPKMSMITVSGAFRLDSAMATPGLTNGTDFQFAGDINMTRGAHQIGFGANLIHAHLNFLTGTSAPGAFNFSAQNTGLALADLMLGFSSSFVQSQLAPLYMMQYSSDLYVQDTWKVNRNFTVVGGLRWEPYLPPSTKYVQSGILDNTAFLQGVRSKVFVNAPAGLLFPGDPGVDRGTSIDSHGWAHFAPRLGLSWDPKGDGKMVIRAAAGTFFDYGHLDSYRNVLNSAPTGGQISISGATFANPYGKFAGGNPFPLTFGPNALFPLASSQFAIPRGLKHPTVHQWNFAIQRQVSGSWLATVAYMGSMAVHETGGHEGNYGIYVPGTCSAGQYGLTAAGACSTAGNLNARRLLTIQNPTWGPYYSTFGTIDDTGTRSYNAMVLSLQRRIAKGFTALTNYTWSHCIDSGISTNTNVIQTWDPNRRAFDRGNCELDRRHNFNLSAVYQLPRFNNRATRILATGWQVSTVVRVISGPWVTVSSGLDNAFTGTADQWPNIIGSPYAANKGADSRVWLNPAAFAQPALGTYGNMAAQNIQGPGGVNFDVALARLFKISEGVSVQLRGEAFNVFNHVNPGGASAPASGATTGASSPAALLSGVDVTLSDPLFGKIVNAADPRIMQVALKITF